MQTFAKQQRIVAREEARNCLNAKGNRLLLILGILSCILATIALSIAVDSIFVALNLHSRLGNAVAALCAGSVRFLLFYFLAFPLYLGVVSVSGKLSRGEQADFFSFFEWYRSFRMLWRAWRIQIRVLWAAFPFLAISALRYMTYFHQFPELEYAATAILTSALAPILIWAFFSTGRMLLFVRLAVRDEEHSLRSIGKRTARLAKGNMVSVNLLRLRCWGELALSLLSIGVVTLMHSLPMSLLVGDRILIQLEQNNNQ